MSFYTTPISFNSTIRFKSLRRRLGAIVILLMTPVIASHAQLPAAPVKVIEVSEVALFRQLQLVGTVNSPQVATLSTQINGLVETVMVEEGSQVKRGDVLLHLDKELAALQLQSVNAELQQAEETLLDARRRLLEARSLVKNRSIAESTLKDIAAEVDINTAVVSQARAQLQYRQALLERHNLRAPFDGVISRKLAEQGQWLNTGTGVFELVATQGLRLDFYIAEEFAAIITDSGQLSFSLSAQPKQQYPAKITHIVPVADTKARTFLVRADIIDEQLPKNIRLFPGMSVVAKLRLDTGRVGLVVPRDAVLLNQDGSKTLWTVVAANGQANDQATVKESRVETGLSFDGKIEIISGLGQQDRVVVSGNEALRNQQRIKIIQ